MQEIDSSKLSRSQRALHVARKWPVVGMVFRRLDARQREVLSLLRQTTLFQDLSDRDLLQILHLLHERVYARGETIFNQGDSGHGFYVVFSGEVEISQSGAGRANSIARLGPSTFFGDVSFMDGGPRSATAVALERTELLGIYRTELLELLERKPHLASKIMFAMAQQVSRRLRMMLETR